MEKANKPTTTTKKTNFISKKLNEILPRQNPTTHKLLNTKQKEKILKTVKKKKEKLDT